MFDYLPTGYAECLDGSEERNFANIFDGEFTLSFKGINMTIMGAVFIQWSPNSHIVVVGSILSIAGGVDLIDILQRGKLLQLHFNGLYFGSVQLVSLSGDELHGVLNEPQEKSDVQIESFTFHLLNSKKIANKCAKTFGGNGAEWSLCRLENEDFLVDIQHYSGYDDIFQKLSRSGGFVLTHFGKVKKKSGLMTIDESNQLIECLNSFISLINGKKLGLVGIKKYMIDGGVSKNLLGYQNDWYKTVRRCIPNPVHVREDFLSELWICFYKSWFKDQESENIRLLVQLYVESNINLVYIENCLILSQTAIELAANLKFSGISFRTTASKIRALLKKLSVSHDIPKVLKALRPLKNMILTDKNGGLYKVNDGPDCITEIRNSVVHPEIWGRENLSKISTGMRTDAWLLANWYVELCILNLINYQGLYKNRLITDEVKIERVPWAL